MSVGGFESGFALMERGSFIFEREFGKPCDGAYVMYMASDYVY